MGKRQLPLFARNVQAPAGEAQSLDRTLELDAHLQWEPSRFAKGAPVGAEIRGADIRIRSLPFTGSGRAFYGRYLTVGPEDLHPPPSELNLKVLADAVAAAFDSLKPGLEWSGLHPVLFALLSSLRPRRYVELGVLYGASFFAVCVAAEQLKLNTQCIAVDAWIDEPDPFPVAESVFDRFPLAAGG